MSRRTSYSADELRPLMAPRVVAVVGASEKAGSFGGAVLRNLLSSDAVEAIPINPNAASVLGRAAIPSLLQVEQPIDLVAVCVPASRVAEVLRDAVAVNARAAIVYASGFSESDSDNAVEYQSAVEQAIESGLRVLGPNCLGLMDFHRNVDVTFLSGTMPVVQPGRIALVSQSGALGYLLAQAQTRGVGFSSWVSSGNSSDIDCIDLAHYFLDDVSTDVVVVAFEGANDGQRILELGRAARSAGKPVIVHKLGRSVAGAQSAKSHTGTFTGSANVYSAAFSRVGLVEVRHFDELLDVARTFAAFGRPAARGVGVLTSSGGAAIVAADEAEDAGVLLPALSRKAAEDFARIVPGFGVVGNPADLTAEAVKDPGMYKNAVRAFAENPDFAATLIPLTVASTGVTDVRAQAILEVAAELPESNLGVVWMSEWIDGPGVQSLEASPDVVVYRSWRAAMTALGYWSRWERDGDHREAKPETQSSLPDATAIRGIVDEVLTEGDDQPSVLTEVEGKRVFQLLGLPTTDPIVYTNGWTQDPGRLEGLGLPAVAKIVSRTVLHKWRAGGVLLNLNSEKEIAEAVENLAQKFAADGTPCPVLVESMVHGNAEWFVGLKRDETFGPVVTCARGGVDVEASKPVLFVGPYTMVEVKEAISNHNFGPLATTIPVDQLAHAVIAASQLAGEVAEIQEMDINPLIDTADGLIAVDSVIMVERTG